MEMYWLATGYLLVSVWFYSYGEKFGVVVSHFFAISDINEPNFGTHSRLAHCVKNKHFK